MGRGFKPVAVDQLEAHLREGVLREPPTVPCLVSSVSHPGRDCGESYVER